MIVTIDGHSEPVAGLCTVAFTSSHGKGEAKWYGDMPGVGQEYDVELDVPQALSWGEEVMLSAHAVPAIGRTQSGYYLVGWLERVDEDCATLRQGPDLVLLEVIGTPFNPGQYVMIRCDWLALFPFRL